MARPTIFASRFAPPAVLVRGYILSMPDSRKSRRRQAAEPDCVPLFDEPPGSASRLNKASHATHDRVSLVLAGLRSERTASRRAGRAA